MWCGPSHYTVLQPCSYWGGCIILKIVNYCLSPPFYFSKLQMSHKSTGYEMCFLHQLLTYVYQWYNLTSTLWLFQNYQMLNFQPFNSFNFWDHTCSLSPVHGILFLPWLMLHSCLGLLSMGVGGAVSLLPLRNFNVFMTENSTHFAWKLQSLCIVCLWFHC